MASVAVRSYDVVQLLLIHCLLLRPLFLRFCVWFLFCFAVLRDTERERERERERAGHMGQYQLLSVLSARLSPLNIDHSRNLPVEICGINYTEK